MRHSKKYIEKCSIKGKSSQKIQNNERLANALEYGHIRSIENVLFFRINTFNPFSKIENVIELWHEPSNGNGKYSVYLNGEKWRNGWSRFKFVNWLFSQINKVMIHNG